MLATLLAPAAASAQQGAPVPLAAHPATLSELSAAASLSRMPKTEARMNSSVSLPRHLLGGAGVGAAVGTAFALAVVSLADCAGPTCTGERVVGVVGHALAGAAVGALGGGMVYLVRK